MKHASLKNPHLSPTTGFTLIELMITVAIIAILASVAYPSYQQYVIRSNRSEMEQFMLDVANREEEFLLNNRSYTNLAGLNLSVPTRLQSLYTVTAVAATTCAGTTINAPGYCITSTPVATSIQKNDGTLTLDSQGNKKPVDKWK
jgi:type IV pilus assembly protein PilE